MLQHSLVGEKHDALAADGCPADVATQSSALPADTAAPAPEVQEVQEAEAAAADGGEHALSAAGGSVAQVHALTAAHFLRRPGWNTIATLKFGARTNGAKPSQLLVLVSYPRSATVVPDVVAAVRVLGLADATGGSVGISGSSGRAGEPRPLCVVDMLSAESGAVLRVQALSRFIEGDDGLIPPRLCNAPIAFPAGRSREQMRLVSVLQARAHAQAKAHA
jgi:hypothetical protein